MILLYCILTILIRLKKNIVVYIFGSLFLVIYLCVFCKPNQDILSIDRYFLYVVIGYLLSPLLIIITYMSVFFTFPRIRFSFFITWDLLFHVLWEEVIWRHLFLYLLLGLHKNLYFNICVCLIQLVLFVVAHSNIKSLRNGMDMFLYSAFLLVSAYLYPGMNLGLHLGRNVSCSNLMEEQNETDQYK